MRNLRKLVKRILEERLLTDGFVYDDLDRDTVVFRAKRRRGFFLSIGFLDSRFDPKVFAVEYFLSRTARHNDWSPLWSRDADFRPESRLFALLTQKEKERFFPHEMWTSQQVDAWWREENSSGLETRLNEISAIVLQCAERFDTKVMRNEVSSSKALGKKVAFLRSVRDLTMGKEKMSVVLNEKLASRLVVKPELPQIAKSAIHLLDNRGEEFDNSSIYNISCNCYNMFFREYPLFTQRCRAKS